MAISFRLVKDKDFEQISTLYSKYIDWQENNSTESFNQKRTPEEMVAMYHKKKFDPQTLNYKPEKEGSPDHFGFVAEEGGKILAYYKWGGRLNREGKQCGCYISVWRDGYDKEAKQLLEFCFDELANLGFKLATGHMSRRMVSNSKHNFFKEYVHRIIVEDDGESLLFERDLRKD